MLIQGFLFFMIWLIFASICIFSARTIIMIIGSARERSKNIFKPDRKLNYRISVIVPARNEEDKIEKCIRQIMDSDYPKELFEVVAVNDRSDDSTLTILNSLTNEFSNLKVINIKSDLDKNNLKGKPGALHQGILSSSGEIIMMTDADCVVNTNWISSIEQRFSNPDIGLVPSYTLITDKSGFDKLQAVEWIYMHTMASAGVGFDNPLGCYGNNLSIRRSVYDHIGGYPKIKFSVTEDLALLKAVFKAGYKVNYVCSPESTVTTLPCETLKEYVSQHKRWAVGGIDLGYDAIYFVFTSLMLWVGLIASIIIMNPYLFFAVLATRFIGDFLVLKPVMNILKQNKLVPWIIPSILFFMLMEIIIPPLLIDSRIVWKGQVFNKRS
jgi:cellulose synthase/poly-beta-1,6-N-acetylglucosamine synthase-like glycosyltransferase